MSIYDFEVKKQDGSMQSLADFEGKVLLIVNTATGCGFTPQYKELQDMVTKRRVLGFEILDFPCNQFGEQAPGTDEEIKGFCNLRYAIDFPQFSKIEVNGDNAEPLFAYLATEKPFEGFGMHFSSIPMLATSKAINNKYGDKAYIKWNFTKFLVDRSGKVVARFEPTTPMSEVEAAVSALL